MKVLLFVTVLAFYSLRLFSQTQKDTSVRIIEAPRNMSNSREPKALIPRETEANKPKQVRFYMGKRIDKRRMLVTGSTEYNVADTFVHLLVCKPQLGEKNLKYRFIKLNGQKEKVVDSMILERTYETEYLIHDRPVKEIYRIIGAGKFRFEYLVRDSVIANSTFSFK